MNENLDIERRFSGVRRLYGEAGLAEAAILACGGYWYWWSWFLGC